MFPRMKKKYSSGIGDLYISRKRALQKLQISLNCFRKLCIYKGVYPCEPIKRKEAQKGQAGYKILYRKKDIQFLYNDDLLWHFRDVTAHYRKIVKARALQQLDKVEQLKKNMPVCCLNKVIRDRYPRIIDALRGLSECLVTLSAYATLPSSLKYVELADVTAANRLTLEFMLAVIEARALRTVFVTIEGYHFEVEFMDEKIIWVAPFDLPFQPRSVKSVDFKTMAAYAKFYQALLRATNANLYNMLNLTYPPQLEQQQRPVSELEQMDKAAVLNATLVHESRVKRDGVDNGVDVIKSEDFGDFPNDPHIQKIKTDLESVAKLKTLFEGLRFYLNREVPITKLVFIVRCFGGKVSWDESAANGATFDENDPKITHQIIDRPLIENHVASRHYVQPQWLFDSINSRKLVPVHRYCPGAILPPHVYPYATPEQLKNMSDADDEIKNDYDTDVDADDDETGYETGSRAMSIAETTKTSDDDSACDNGADDVEDDKMAVDNPIVAIGLNRTKSTANARKKQRKQELRMREKMVRRKYKKLYAKMKNSEKLKKEEIAYLKKKRREIAQKKANK